MIELVDMCSLQDPHTVDFKKMKDSGVRGVWLKSSQYSGSMDPTFFPGGVRVMQAGLNLGAYHFAYCGRSAKEQMHFAFGACGGHGAHPGELPFMLDWEYAERGDDGKVISEEATVAWLVEAAEEASALWGGKLIIYTYPDFARQHQPHLASSGLEKYDLCLAAYPNIRTIPKPWDKVTVQQYAGNDGRVPGVAVPCDRDRFLGSEEEYQGFLGYDITKPVEEVSGGTVHAMPEFGGISHD